MGDDVDTGAQKGRDRPGGHGKGRDHGIRTAADWIEVLDHPSRMAWQKPDEVVAALGLRGDELVVEVGSGSGTFTTRLAAVVPRGRVIATDVDPDLHAHVAALVETSGLTNVVATLVREDETGIPATADLVFLGNVLHCFPDPAAWLSDVSRTLRPGARIAILEFNKGEHPVGPPDSVKLSRDQLHAAFEAAALGVETAHLGMMPYHDLFVLVVDARD